MNRDSLIHLDAIDRPIARSQSASVPMLPALSPAIAPLHSGLGSAALNRLPAASLTAFVSGMTDSPDPNKRDLDAARSNDRESVRIMVIGSRHGVTRIVQTLYRLGFAEVGEWSPFLPAPRPGEVMKILTRSFQPDEISTQ